MAVCSRTLKKKKIISHFFFWPLFIFEFVFTRTACTLIHISAGPSTKPIRRFYGQCSCRPPAHHQEPTRKRAQRMSKRKSPTFTTISVYLRKALNCFLVILSYNLFFPKWMIVLYFILHHVLISLIILFTFDLYFIVYLSHQILWMLDLI